MLVQIEDVPSEQKHLVALDDPNPGLQLSNTAGLWTLLPTASVTGSVSHLNPAHFS